MIIPVWFRQSITRGSHNPHWDFFLLLFDIQLRSILQRRLPQRLILIRHLSPPWLCPIISLNRRICSFFRQILFFTWILRRIFYLLCLFSLMDHYTFSLLIFRIFNKIRFFFIFNLINFVLNIHLSLNRVNFVSPVFLWILNFSYSTLNVSTSIITHFNLELLFINVLVGNFR